MNAEKERIVLFGGTFAPPHLGHVHAVQTAIEILAPDELIVMPTAIPPHKCKTAEDTPEVRFEMCVSAFGKIDKVTVSDHEIGRGGISYTVDTLKHLTKPNRDIFLLCGGDMFLTVEKWYHSDEIFRMATVVGIPRVNDTSGAMQQKKQEYEKNFSARVLLIGADPFEISSTEIRDKIKRGEGLYDCLPEEVIHIIEREKLYYE